MPDGSFTTVENFVLAAPEEQFAQVFGEGAWCAHDEIQRSGDGGVQVGIAYQLPADFIDEGQADVEDDEVDVGEVGGSPVHIPGLSVFDGLWAEWHAFVYADGLDTQF